MAPGFSCCFWEAQYELIRLLGYPGQLLERSNNSQKVVCAGSRLLRIDASAQPPIQHEGRLGSSSLGKRQGIRPIVSEPMFFRPFLFEEGSARQISVLIG